MKTTEILEKMYQTSEAIAYAVVNGDVQLTFEEGVNLHVAKFKIGPHNASLYFGYDADATRVSFGYGDICIPLRNSVEQALATYLCDEYSAVKLESLNKEKARIEREIEKVTNNKQA